MAFRRDAGAAGAVDRNRKLRQCALGRQHVRNYADIRAEPDKFCRGEIVQSLEILHEFFGAERGLVKNPRAGGVQRRVNLPAGGVFDAVGHGKILSFLRLQIIFMMGVTGKDDGLARFFCLRDFFATRGTMATASLVPSAPEMKSFCISTTTKTSMVMPPVMLF